MIAVSGKTLGIVEASHYPASMLQIENTTFSRLSIFRDLIVWKAFKTIVAAVIGSLTHLCGAEP